jgi:flagellar motility protein MotE (MotC chaperone)
MAKNDAHAAEKKRLKAERDKLKKEEARQKKDIKKRAKEIAKQEAKLSDDEEAGGFSAFLLTLIIVFIWVAILCVVIKLDVGGFGSDVLAPVLKDVPVVNKILPEGTVTEVEDGGAYGGYNSIEEAVNQIQVLKAELESYKSNSTSDNAKIAELEAEIERLKTFEANQVEFQRIKTEFYEEVVYAENGPGAEEYLKYYENMDPTTAEYLYKQVALQLEESKEIEEYAQTYSEMDADAAAKIFEAMTDDLKLVSRILSVMNAEARGDILAEMDPAIAAKLTKIMDPES